MPGCIEAHIIISWLRENRQYATSVFSPGARHCVKCHPEFMKGFEMATKKSGVKKSAAKKTVAKTTVAKKSPAKKAVAKKSPAKKAPLKKVAASKSQSPSALI